MLRRSPQRHVPAALALAAVCTCACPARARDERDQQLASSNASATPAQLGDATAIEVQWDAPPECPDAAHVRRATERLLGQPLARPGSAPIANRCTARHPTSVPTYGKADFDQWYRDVPGTNIDVVYPLTLTFTPGGQYEYDSRKSGFYDSRRASSATSSRRSTMERPTPPSSATMANRTTTASRASCTPSSRSNRRTASCGSAAMTTLTSSSTASSSSTSAAHTNGHRERARPRVARPHGRKRNPAPIVR
jgi:hypothetical protein